MSVCVYWYIHMFLCSILCLTGCGSMCICVYADLRVIFQIEI